MLKEKRYLMARCFTLVLALFVTGMMVGCSQSLISSQDHASLPDNSTRLTKKAASAGYTQSASGKFKTNTNGKLEVKFPKYDAAVRVHSVEFVVKKGALDNQTDITMDVTTGQTLDDVQVVFGPSGTAFDPPATLTIKLAGSKQADLIAYHFSTDQDGQTVVDEVVLDDGRPGWKVVIDVPGFSRYSLGGDR